MNTLRGCSEVLLDEIPFTEASIHPERDIFCRYAAKIFPQYSGDEISNLYEVHVAQGTNENCRTVFDVIYDTAEKFLEKKDDVAEIELVCKVNQGLRWRGLFLKLGQDVFTTAFLAKNKKPVLNFMWKPVIDICAEGVPEGPYTDNHFHLNGSTQIFSLNFICLMNHISCRHKIFKKLDTYYDGRFVLDMKGGHCHSLYERCRIAATLRLYLFSKVSHVSDDIFDGDIRSGRLLDVDATDELTLQCCMESLRSIASDSRNYSLLDYAQMGLDERCLDSKNGLGILAGERQFLYLCFCNAFANADVRAMENWTALDDHYFYVYLILKNAFRRELVQTNGRLGFANFSDYQDRKEQFIAGFPDYERAALHLAVNYTLGGELTSTLEARICPKATVEKMRKEILRIYDTAFLKNDTDDNIDKDAERSRLALVLHFPKAVETSTRVHDKPRHFEKRNEVHKKARAIVCMLANRSSLRQHVRGIDACANEISCRPEVFAPTFRYLMNAKIELDSLEGASVQTLNATYHVGEDFLDIADGLRAIDEVIFYMGFKKGNRLGHALSLGIDAEIYYSYKKYQMILSNQDLLDNIVWLVERSKKCKIPIASALYVDLNKKAKNLSNYIYDQDLDLTSYYRAWRLRGDDPSLYTNPQGLLEESCTCDVPNFSAYFLKNPSVENAERLDATVYRWYHRYHFDETVKGKGAEKTVFQIERNLQQDYIHLITAMQAQLLLEIKQKDIYIETNPSSNFLIGPFDRYENHPIFRFFSVKDLPENSACVSINTDDLGVFDTSLQNEYALLATALGKNQRFTRDEIRTYLESIQAFGKKQVFQ